ncbi:MgtC/SapB family protein [Thermoflexus sp.]|uniref:MgtC/SapB family protein n=2 Tax=Thermoflexus sp. TaxID=1969742 RepID=UPI0025DC46D1|nr:MgtC/SapB family protein [Thermoflexus sp.]MCS6963600.1 MgtC/SapB family protein [Thermoflexus sp.]MCX7691707.1 MgtC/SapB family protein [Thermoflexus sp.]MDW8065610.1 MgtC/SapB family protein [Anaerolineae bacterium]MDW8183889.1 MgtC/SapB family protein [Anaerolineae bacterium]
MGDFRGYIEPIGVSLGIGLLIGMEREWAHKDMGLRTFALAALAGCLAWLIHPVAAFLVLGAAISLVSILNIRSLLVDRSLEMTTSVALLVTLLLGMVVAQGYALAAAATAVLVTMLLAWKAELVRFTVGLSLEELRSIVLFGLLTLVIYPLLPEGLPPEIDPLGLVNLRAAWLVVVILSAIGLVNYALLRLYGARGIHFTGLLGGLVNSTATVSELARRCRGHEGQALDLALEGMLLANIAMMARNGLILGIFAPAALLHGWLAVGLMSGITGLMVLRTLQRNPNSPAPSIRLAFPFSLRHSLLFGMFYLVIRAAVALADRFLGLGGFMMVTFLGGLVSSASTAAAAATLAAQGRIPPETAGLGVVLASMASLLFHVPMARLGGLQGPWLRRLGIASALTVAVGILGLALEGWR